MIIKISYSHTGATYFIDCDDLKMIQYINDIFVGFNIEKTFSEHLNYCDKKMEIIKLENDRYHVRNKKDVFTYTLSQTLGFMTTKVLDELGQDAGDKVFLHGGCIQSYDKTHCFLGRTKSGKSTVTYLLCRDGRYKYLTDDLICVNKKSECMPFLKPIFLRETKYLNHKSDTITIRYQNDMRYCYLPPNMCDKSQSLKLDNIFILERNLDAPFSVEKLSVSSAFINIWQNMHTSETLIEKRRIAMFIAQNTKTFKVCYRDVLYDLNSIKALLN